MFCQNVCYYVNLCVSALPNFCDALTRKLVQISKQNFTSSFGALRLWADYILVEIGPKIKGGGFKN